MLINISCLISRVHGTAFMSQTLSHTHRHSLTHTHTHTHTHTQTHSLSHRQTHTHTHTHRHSLSHTHTYTDTLSLSHIHRTLKNLFWLLPVYLRNCNELKDLQLKTTAVFFSLPASVDLLNSLLFFCAD